MSACVICGSEVYEWQFQTKRGVERGVEHLEPFSDHEAILAEAAA